ncbi:MULTISPECIES: cation diffusion facilitator family transporter [unclassified Desulfovibrio]|uniref:cation diffusion facilitator family transporter n=1 Tax=unclassified Desulfovibrio TaxID=2593640 RepID=UPI000F5D9660|nr:MULTISPECIES: cation diffusion facilitator family transporter [unclassified Desulfovibrio]RRD70096.1 cation transporter [Desulfovibrio sp. OH1209_COT-279]RRD86640.1 cation transporter [Desulfovibrio sp. OH1186_COT-070]
MAAEYTAEQEKYQAALFSLLAACILTTVKLLVGIHTNSLGVLSEALHSGLDLLAAAMTVGAVRVASRPADSSHPYGHGKAESLSALAQTLLLFGICLWVVYEAAQRLMAGESPVTPSLWGVGVMAFSIVVDISRVRSLRRVARKYKSQALEADALHFSTDILSSAVVLVGVLAVWLASVLHLPSPLSRVLVQADTVAALLVALIIFRASWRMAAEAVNTLMDSGSAREREAVAQAVGNVPGIASVGGVRVRSSGAQSFVDLSVGVDSGIRVSEGHRLAHLVERAVTDVLPGADVTVHVEPCSRDAGGEKNPFLLIQTAASAHGLSVHHIRLLQGDAGPRVELHVELPGEKAFAQAYEDVRLFEEALRARWPAAEIVSHLEPELALTNGEAGRPVPEALLQMAWNEIQVLAAREPLVRHPHGFSAYTLPEQGICVAFHCVVGEGLTVREAHAVSERLEQQLRLAVPVLARITIHMEPPCSSPDVVSTQPSPLSTG